MAIKELGTHLPAWNQLQWSAAKEIVNRDDANKWSGKLPPPEVGAKVVIGVNAIGAGVVLGYFEEEGFLGVLVQPDSPPPWYLKQNGGKPCHVFGGEIEE